MYNVKVFDKLSLRYYFLGELQEKDFFDRREKINKRLNVILRIILNGVKHNEESYMTY